MGNPSRQTTTRTMSPADRAVEGMYEYEDAPQLPTPVDAARLEVVAKFSQGYRRPGIEQMQKVAAEIGAAMGADAFYSLPFNGGNVEGLTIGAAQALLGEWGAVKMGVEEVRRVGRTVTLRAEVIDLAKLVLTTNDFTFTISPPPKKFADSPDQIARWEAMQINAAGSKAVRNAILDVLPKWYATCCFRAAKRAAAQKNPEKPERPLADRISDAVKHFATKLDVHQLELEGALKRERKDWTEEDLDQLRSIKAAIERGEETVEGLFGPRKETEAGARG